jgi:Ca2+ transporting ATPase
MSNCTNICSDKTGTLTENQMTVVKGWVAGEVFDALPMHELPQPVVMNFLSEGIAINSSQTSTFYREEGKPLQTVGNKTECALLIFLDALGINYAEVRTQLNEKIFQRFTFSSARKRMSTLIWADQAKGIVRMYCKGAPEIILRRSLYFMEKDGRILPLDDGSRDNLQKLISGWAAMGLRTLCLAYRDVEIPKTADPVTPVTLGVADIPVIRPTPKDGAGTSAAAEEAAPTETEGPIAVVSDPADDKFKFAEAPDNDMVVYALVGIQDPVRKEVPQAVADCQDAGITVRMVTGDNITTAKSIARECHILEEGDVAIEGPEFAKLSDDQLDKIIPKLRVIARCSPSDKQRLVRRLIELGEVVAVTGDGTNDVPALKEADVGLAMGIRGTDIAKQASDIVILDDNFQSIVRSVMWGRNVYDNIRKFLQFQLTVNVAALAIVFIGAVSQRGAPLNAIQLLWVNLIMDTLAALALGTERPTRALLQRKPFGRYDRLISPYMMRAIIGQAAFQIGILLALLYAGKSLPWLDVPCAYATRNYLREETTCMIDGRPATNVEIDAQTTVLKTCIFNTFVYCQVFNEINSRKVNGEWNVWEKLLSNWMFPVIMLVVAVGQAILVVFPGQWLGVAPFPGIGWKQWLTCMVIAAFTLPYGALLNCIPVPKPRPKKLRSEAGGCCGRKAEKPKGEEDEDDDD